MHNLAFTLNLKKKEENINIKLCFGRKEILNSLTLLLLSFHF